MTVCHHLESFLEDTLDAPDRDAFVAHLDSCAGCRDELDKWSEITSQFATWVDTRENSVIPEPAEANDFIQELAPRIQTEPADTPRPEGLLKRLRNRFRRKPPVE